MRTTNNKLRWMGAAAGLTVGLIDGAFMWMMGIQMTLGDLDVLPAIGLFYGLSFAGLGYLVGRLVEAGRDMSAAAHTIERQYAELESGRAREAHLEELARIGRMSASVAHEVRNPLGVIRSASGILAESAQGARQERAARLVQEEVDRLDNFVRSMLDYAKPLHAEPADTPVRELFQRVDALAESAADEKQVTLQFSSPANLSWPLDSRLMIGALATLVDNSVQAVEAGGHVRVDAKQDATQLSITVTDDGAGVDADVDIFEPFVTTRAQGTGLGLPMARRIAEAHGGALVHLGPGFEGRGAAFEIRMPGAS